MNLTIEEINNLYQDEKISKEVAEKALDQFKKEEFIESLLLDDEFEDDDEDEFSEVDEFEVPVEQIKEQKKVIKKPKKKEDDEEDELTIDDEDDDDLLG